MLLSSCRVTQLGTRFSSLRVTMAMRHLSITSSPQTEEKCIPGADYRPGGDHPMKPGETVHARYEIMRKLGWGEYSTVWLVKFRSSKRYAAMKVMKAEVTDLPELHESDYLHRVLAADPTHPGFRHNLHLFDEFRIHGPNGKHLCLVTELLGESLDQYAKRFPHKRVPIPMIKTISRQLILAIMYLHDRCGIIHTDVKTNNVLFTLPEEVLSTVLTSMPAVPIADPTSPPLSDGEVKLIDLGVACWADRRDEHFTDLIQSPELRAPEVVVGADWGKPVDIWSLGCLVYELATGSFLISDSVHEMSIPYLHTVFFGPYPRSLTAFEKNKFSDLFFKDDGSQLHPQTEQISLADTIRTRKGDENIEGLVSFLDLIFRLDPGERAGLQTLLDYPFIADHNPTSYVGSLLVIPAFEASCLLVYIVLL
ncbi:kinase-like protein [Mycena polygramma]|nr:kinase-like protein [Mycena polygramma]